MSKKHYVYVPCIKYGHNGGVMGNKFKNMQDAWDWLLELLNVKKMNTHLTGLWILD